MKKQTPVKKICMKVYDTLSTHYDNGVPYEYPVVNRVADAPRYIPSDNGFWYRPDAVQSGEAVLSCVGDLMCEPQMQNSNKYGSTYFLHPCFKYVQEKLKSSDFAIGNLETTVTDSTPYAGECHVIEGKYHCNAPESCLDALRYAGFDALVNANNHNCDSGASGLIDTVNALDRHGFMHTGTFIEANQSHVLFADVNGIKLAVISFATHFNKNESCFTSLGRTVLLNKYSKKKAQDDIAYAREKGAEFVLIYMHWGTEYTHEVNDRQREMAQELADCGADYIVGSHPHCLQPRELVTGMDGKTVPVIYSMGNFITNESKDICKHTGILQLRLTKTDSGISVQESFIPCYIFKKFDVSRYAPVPTSRQTGAASDREFLKNAENYIMQVMDIDAPARENEATASAD